MPTPLAHDRLRSLIHYDPTTGQLRWLKAGGRRRQSSFSGSPSIRRNGHVRYLITVDWEKYYVSRLIWFYMTGQWPSAQVDHINGDTADNRWNNLRLATPAQNRRNQPNISGLPGTSWVKSRGKWEARIAHKYIGLFDTEQEAHEAYKQRALDLYGEYAHPSLKPKP